MNASVTVADCTLEVDNIVGLKRNVAGKVLFRRNLHRKRPKGVSQHYNELEVISRRWPETAIFFLDSVSKLEVVDHDFKRKYVVEFEDEELVSHSIGTTFPIRSNEELRHVRIGIKMLQATNKSVSVSQCHLNYSTLNMAVIYRYLCPTPLDCCCRTMSTLVIRRFVTEYILITSSQSYEWI